MTFIYTITSGTQVLFKLNSEEITLILYIPSQVVLFLNFLSAIDDKPEKNGMEMNLLDFQRAFV